MLPVSTRPTFTKLKCSCVTMHESTSQGVADSATDHALYLRCIEMHCIMILSLARQPCFAAPNLNENGLRIRTHFASAEPLALLSSCPVVFALFQRLRGLGLYCRAQLDRHRNSTAALRQGKTHDQPCRPCSTSSWTALGASDPWKKGHAQGISDGTNTQAASMASLVFLRSWVAKLEGSSPGCCRTSVAFTESFFAQASVASIDWESLETKTNMTMQDQMNHSLRPAVLRASSSPPRLL